MVYFFENDSVISYKNTVRENPSINLAICTSVLKKDFLWHVNGKVKIKPGIMFTFLDKSEIFWAFNTSEKQRDTYKEIINLKKTI